ncbi:hypothetical protein B0J13DRAFT_676576 [Dactylonectria estremocensis]|uniref:Core Histone H2A/H2B/H3 domain-containing protein n=1 Tax=Dactylonectria estremocensis TaxID=1079267 RepID=A0A9P9EM33_9HYPO|nr:hypothetical protein B0J13DRAFT_676576 [Dactylonectria estremocensis]
MNSSSGGLIISYLAFKRVVQEILHGIRPSSNTRLGPIAIRTVQVIAEGKIAEMFKAAHRLSRHAGRETLVQADLARLRDIQRLFNIIGL